MGSESGNDLSPARHHRVGRWVVIGAIVLLVLKFYSWAAAPSGGLFGHFNGESTYYNLLIKGFQKGHLSLDVPTPPGLLELDDPYDPKQNGGFGMHDVSYFKGKFYLYFGAAPAVTLYWPFHALTGKYLEDPQALFLFCAIGFLAAVALAIAIRRVYFPGLGLLTGAAGVLVLGFANMVPVLLRRQAVYEVAVGSADCFFMLALLALFLGLHARRRNRWLAVASLAYGLAIAARPTYLFGGGILLLPVLAEWWGGRRELGSRRRAWRRRALATLGPVILVGIGLLVYNYERFRSPFEFGQRLALSGADETRVTHFSLSYIWYNCRLYLFSPSGLSTYFPFVRVIYLGKGPPGHYGAEDPYGIFPNIPFVFFALLAPLACWGRPRLAKFCAAVALAALAVAAVIFSFQFATNRYMVDFLPGFILLAVVGFWGLLDALGRSARVWAGLAGGVLIAWSVGFNLFAACNHNELLRISDGPVFLRLLHFFDQPRYYFDRLVGRKYGAIDFAATFPTDQKGKLQPLVISGTQFLSDYLYILYLDDAHVVLGFEHTGYGGPVSPPIAVDYRKPHQFEIDWAAFYPPIGDPYFDGIDPAAIESFRTHLRVTMDGEDVFNVPQQTFPAYHERPLIGRSVPGEDSLGKEFTGKIADLRIVPKDWLAAVAVEKAGPLMISLSFPAGNAGAHEPLLTSGVTGEGDVLVANFVDATHITLSLDHWSHGGPTSPPIEIRPGTPELLEVSFGSFFPDSARPADVNPERWAAAQKRLTVSLDRKVVFDVETDFYPASSETVVVGRNPIGSSSCVAKFSGTVMGAYRRTLK